MYGNLNNSGKDNRNAVNPIITLEVVNTASQSFTRGCLHSHTSPLIACPTLTYRGGAGAGVWSWLSLKVQPGSAVHMFSAALVSWAAQGLLHTTHTINTSLVTHVSSVSERDTLCSPFPTKHSALYIFKSSITPNQLFLHLPVSLWLQRGVCV